jgi:hypothetical protein
MAKNYQQLIDDRSMYKKWHEDARRREDKANRRISALQGVITRMKKKAAGDRKRVPQNKRP